MEKAEIIKSGIFTPDSSYFSWLKDIKDKLGIEGEIRATVDEEGKVEVEVDEETEKEDKVEVKDEEVEKNKDEGEESKIVEDDLFSMVEDDPSEVEKFEKELEQQYEKYMGGTPNQKEG